MCFLIGVACGILGANVVVWPIVVTVSNKTYIDIPNDENDEPTPIDDEPSEIETPNDEPPTKEPSDDVEPPKDEPIVDEPPRDIPTDLPEPPTRIYSWDDFTFIDSFRTYEQFIEFDGDETIWVWEGYVEDYWNDTRLKIDNYAWGVLIGSLIKSLNIYTGVRTTYEILETNHKPYILLGVVNV
jgi:hypothetical protein